MVIKYIHSFPPKNKETRTVLLLPGRPWESLSKDSLKLSRGGSKYGHSGLEEKQVRVWTDSRPQHPCLRPGEGGEREGEESGPQESEAQADF